ncbi:redoxin family protein [Azoarcus indigens]|uniref:Thiol-disulfide isomerase/thioredoxin n=2 Tax=Azoarcus indigens TaxID=29545 RepID=A0A4R6DYQ2_9RHOO|nr:redoxin family protein [Azoarcus indigens]TDN50495.1 thiol-disulfide isomerase/thioredoxin [Azoarcus indigens]
MKKTMLWAVIACAAVALAIAGDFARRSLLAPETAKPLGVTLAPADLKAASETLFRQSFPDARGNEQALAQWRGKILVVNFWATWCAPCRVEMPEFAEVSQQYAAEGVQFIGVGIDSATNILKFEQATPMPYPLLVAGPQALGLASLFGNTAQALPFTVIIDRRGKVSAIKLGVLKRSELEGKIRPLLAS